MAQSVTTAELARREARANLATRTFFVVVLVFLVGIAALVGVMAVQDNERIKQNRAIQGVIRDCVQSGGHCYQENQRQRLQTVDDINRYSVLAAACAVVAPVEAPVDVREHAIASCIKDRLRAKP